ncbi:lipoprotein [Pantoea ananatis]|uniref:YceK/YidQ family lipoprotein n=1 Tax=Pantoea TaxID=53335 RepID=UPI00051D06D9|nr:YceK/YidQ family lipoprotein [Pantoea ananatis]KGL57770.1 lipoprotein [Pantoea ananatis]KTR46729.1 lipoprotein [Pantoea ananatis]KTR54819.1 lipoprotein [Pantoea ananatis]KTR65284.1 lipoprotein [Pantoea ananatis]KTR68882.1 lipoprotein [Pantoea ananatis]
MNTFAKVILLSLAVVTLSGCGSIISRTMPGQGHGNQFYPGVKWDIRDGAWRVITILDLPLSLVVDTLLIPVDASHGPYE